MSKFLIKALGRIAERIADDGERETLEFIVRVLEEHEERLARLESDLADLPEPAMADDDHASVGETLSDGGNDGSHE